MLVVLFFGLNDSGPDSTDLVRDYRLFVFRPPETNA